MMPFKCSKKKYEENISEICELLMQHEWFYYDLHYDDYNKMEKEVDTYFERLKQLSNSLKDK